MVHLLVATTNRGKQREFQDLLADWPVEIVFPQDLGLEIEVKEEGNSFADIATHKAMAYAQASHMLTLADDSGLEVDALAGAPGVYTARYAGPGASDEDRYRKLLAALGHTPPEERTARFRCTVALAHPEQGIAVAEGTCEGRIAYEPRGTMGFGYDPVFWLPQFGCTMAQLHPARKNQVSHRARAVRAARHLLDRMLEDGEEARDA